MSSAISLAGNIICKITNELWIFLTAWYYHGRPLNACIYQLKLLFSYKLYNEHILRRVRHDDRYTLLSQLLKPIYMLRMLSAIYFSDKTIVWWVFFWRMYWSFGMVCQAATFLPTFQKSALWRPNWILVSRNILLVLKVFLCDACHSNHYYQMQFTWR